MIGYAYNAGNQRTTFTNAAGTWFRYDDENRLTRVYTTNNVHDYDQRKMTYTYDGLGRLRQRVEESWNPYLGYPFGAWEVIGTKRYVYDGMRVIQERDASNVPTVSYTRGSDLSGSLEGAGGIGGLLARSHGYSAGNWSTHNAYHADGNGNVTYLVNSSQTVAASYRYDAFGNTTASSGSLAAANSYRFSSKEAVSHWRASGGVLELYYYGYRWYAPNLQRWVNRDPIGEIGGINLYCYVLNQPINAHDSFGFIATSACAAALAALGEFTESFPNPTQSPAIAIQYARLIANVAVACAPPGPPPPPPEPSPYRHPPGPPPPTVRWCPPNSMLQRPSIFVSPITPALGVAAGATLVGGGTAIYLTFPPARPILNRVAIP